MADEKQLEILKQGHKAWNKWREDNSDIEIDLERADLEGANCTLSNLADANLLEANLLDANLSGATLSRAKLSGANLLGADLLYADLSRANLSNTNLMEANLAETNLLDVNLSKASLAGANLSEANLSGTDLSGADLSRANLSRADILGANFNECTLEDTTLANINLSACIGLETVYHFGPSKIDINTIRLSKGKIPLEFLRGCGLSDLDIMYAKLAAPGLDPDQVTQITYEMHRLYLGQPLQFYSCFISYSSKDQDFAHRIHDDLQNTGVRCWFAPEDMKIGDQIRSTIDREIRLRDKLLVILSENSIKSEWVGDEIEAALEEESKSERLLLFPIRLDDSVMSARDDWAAKIKRRRHIGDFSNWQDEECYRKGFERLLRDLKPQ